MQVHSTFKTTIDLDDPDTGELVQVRVTIKRMTFDEFTEFQRDFQRSAETVPAPADDATAEDQARLKKLAEDEELFAKRFMVDTLERYVSFEPDQVWDDSTGTNKAVVAGADIARVFGARRDVLHQLLRAVLTENILSADQKKALRSRSASERSSSELRRAAAGERPAPTVVPAEPAASMPIADAPGETSQSGPLTA